MAGCEAPLDVQVDQREYLGIMQLFRKRRGIGVFAHAALQPRKGQQAADTPFLLALFVQHIPFRHRFGQTAQRLLQRVHVVRIIADHQAQGARVDLVAGAGDQRVIGIEQQHVGQLALQQRQLARHMDRRDVLFHRPPAQGASQLIARNILHGPVRKLRVICVIMATKVPVGNRSLGTIRVAECGEATSRKRVPYGMYRF